MEGSRSGEWAPLSVSPRAPALRGPGGLGACSLRKERGQWFSLLSRFHFPSTRHRPSPPTGGHGGVLHERPSALCPNRHPTRTPQRGGLRRRPRPMAEMRLHCARLRRPFRKVSRIRQNGGARRPPCGADQPAPGPAPRGVAWPLCSPSGRVGIHLEVGHSSTTMEWTQRSSQGGRARHAPASRHTRTVDPTLSRPGPQCGRQTGGVAERPLVVPQRSPRGRSFHPPDAGTKANSTLAPNAVGVTGNGPDGSVRHRPHNDQERRSSTAESGMASECVPGQRARPESVLSNRIHLSLRSATRHPRDLQRRDSAPALFHPAVSSFLRPGLFRKLGIPDPFRSQHARGRRRPLHLLDSVPPNNGRRRLSDQPA